MVLTFLLGDRRSSCESWRDWDYLPQLAQKLIINNFGNHITIRELFSKSTSDKLTQNIAVLAKQAVSTDLLESLSFVLYLNRAQEAGFSSLNPSTGYELFRRGYDCIEMCNDFAQVLSHIAPGKFKNMQRVNFTQSNGYIGGESQNMVYLEEVGFRGKSLLVDVAAYLYHPYIWAKAFRADNRQSVLQAGVEWLNEVKPGWSVR